MRTRSGTACPHALKTGARRQDKRYGGHHGHYSVADLAAVRGDPITPADIDFAEALHTRQKAAYAKQNRKRQADAAHV
jgi:hypothetical protein